MRRSIKAVGVLIGWIIVYFATIAIVTPIVIALRDPVTQIISLEYSIPVFIVLMSVGVPIMYGAIFLITPLVMATLEVLDDGV